MNLKRMRQKKNSRIINEERIKTITRDFKLKNSIRMNWMIYLNYELILGSLSQALKILNEKVFMSFCKLSITCIQKRNKSPIPNNCRHMPVLLLPVRIDVDLKMFHSAVGCLTYATSDYHQLWKTVKYVTGDHGIH